MKIVIDIPKKTFEEIRKYDLINCGESFAQKLINYIRNGTPLPKNHGRLIDGDSLYNFVVEKYSDGEQLAIDISDMPTIILAESEEKE